MTEWVICGVDDTPGSLAAATVAATLAERMDAGLVVSHVASPMIIPGANTVPNARRELHELQLEEARRLAARVADAAGCDDAQHHAELGDAPRELIRLADEYDATLIVVGTGGRGPLREMLLGSVSHQLCREAHCPVLVVPPPAAATVVGEEQLARIRSA